MGIIIGIILPLAILIAILIGIVKLIVSLTKCLKNKENSEKQRIEILSGEEKEKALKKLKTKKIIVISSIIVFIVLLVMAISDLKYEREQKFTSPNGTNTITIKYDMFSCPTVFKGNKKIFEAKKRYIETVYFDVEWVSEDEFIIKPTTYKYRDDVYTIHIK